MILKITTKNFVQVMRTSKTLMPSQQFTNLNSRRWDKNEYKYIQVEPITSKKASFIISNKESQFVRINVPCEYITGSRTFLPFIPLWRLVKGGTVGVYSNLGSNANAFVSDRILKFKNVYESIETTDCSHCYGKGKKEDSLRSRVCPDCNGTGQKKFMVSKLGNTRLDNLPRANPCRHNRINIAGITTDPSEDILKLEVKDEILELNIDAFYAKIPIKADPDTFPTFPEISIVEQEEKPSEFCKRDIPKDILSKIRSLFSTKRDATWFVSEIDGFTRIRQGPIEFLTKIN